MEWRRSMNLINYQKAVRNLVNRYEGWWQLGLGGREVRCSQERTGCGELLKSALSFSPTLPWEDHCLLQGHSNWQQLPSHLLST